MKRIFVFAIPVLLLLPSCKVRYIVKGKQDLNVLVESVHRQFYKAFQDLQFHDGIKIVPKNLSITFDHSITNTTSGGVTILSIFSTNYKYSVAKDNSTTIVLAPPQVTAKNVASGGAVGPMIRNLNDTLVPRCAFDDLDETTFKVPEIASIKNIENAIISYAREFVQTPNFGLLNDHQINLDLKFTITDDGSVVVSPGISSALLSLTKFTATEERIHAYTDEIKFSYDVVQNDQTYWTDSVNRHRQDSILKGKGGLCALFSATKYTDPTSSVSLNAPPVANQHGYSACVAYSIGYTCISTILSKDGNKFDESNEYSPDFLFARLTNLNDCSGLDIPAAMQMVVDDGDLTIKDMPLIVPDSGKDIDCKTYTKATRTKIDQLAPKARTLASNFATGWIPLDPNDIDQIRLCLDNKEPVVVAFYVSSSFNNMWAFGNPAYNGANVWNSQVGPYYEGHCVCITGYDNKTGLFKVQNSWGLSNKAQDGVFYVTYALVKRGCFTQAYSFVPNRADR